MKLNLILFIGLITLSFSCRKVKESDAVNFIVTDKEEDTLSQVKYQKIPGYEFFVNRDQHSIFLNPKNLSKLPGKFGFGIRSKEQPMTSCWLVFVEADETVLMVEEVPRVPFLYDEFKIDKEIKVDLIYNYIDSLREPPMMYQVYAATSIENNRDTILFQETDYIIQKGKRVASLIIYKDWSKREEMNKRMDELFTTLKRSYD